MILQQAAGYPTLFKRGQGVKSPFDVCMYFCTLWHILPFLEQTSNGDLTPFTLIFIGENQVLLCLMSLKKGLCCPSHLSAISLSFSENVERRSERLSK